MNAFTPLDLNDSTINTDVPLEFLLEIQEIQGRNVAQKYVDYLIDELEKRKVKYEFEIVPNDEEVEINKYIGGSDLTFPYNYFDSFASNIKKVLNDTKKTEENKNYILNLFETKSKENVDADDITSAEIDIDDKTESKKKSALVLPKHYTGLIKIHLLIYDNLNKELSELVLRIDDLKNWLERSERIIV